MIDIEHRCGFSAEMWASFDNVERLRLRRVSEYLKECHAQARRETKEE